MDALFLQAFGPHGDLIGRILAVLVIAGVAIFYFMASRSLNTRRDAPNVVRENQERERRAEAIAAQARAELTDGQKPDVKDRRGGA